jgi:RNA polymerase sigma-B factor
MALRATFVGKAKPCECKDQEGFCSGEKPAVHRLAINGVKMSEALSWNQDSEGLVLRYLRDPKSDLRDLIMVQYASLVERVARRFSGIEAYEDLCQVGYIGLLNALNKFDPEAGVRFNTYATYLVAGEIKHYLRDRSQIIRHPAWLQELRHKVNRTANQLQQELGRVPTEREIAEATGVTESAVAEVFQTQEMLRIASLDAPPAGDDESSEVERLDAADFCPEQLSLEDRMVLEQAMDQLRDLEKKVLIHFHFDALNQTEIASRLGISCNYVSHILRQSLAKLRKILAGEEDKDRLLRRQSNVSEHDILDSLTGVYSERYFRTRLEEEMHRASGTQSQVAIVLLEFKGLEGMRRFYGEASVSDFIQDAAEFLRTNVRRLDVVARFGERGFAIILPEAGTKVSVVRERLLKKAADWMVARANINGGVRLELGFASAPVDGRTSPELLAAASVPRHPSLESNADQKVEAA